jgi:hypothetical protein
MKVSETVTLVLTRGISTEKRELTSIITAVSSMIRRSNRGIGSDSKLKPSATAPRATISHLYGSLNLCRPLN